MRKYGTGSITYDSKSEAAIALLLSKYCAFVPKSRENVHVPAGSTTIDFLVNGAVIEWHPNPRGETQEEYAQRKRELLAESPLRDKELVVVSSLRQLYDNVLQRFGKDVPDYEKIAGEFGGVRGKIKRIK